MASSPWKPTFRYGGISNPNTSSGTKTILDALGTPSRIIDKRQDEEARRLRQERADQAWDWKTDDRERLERERAAKDMYQNLTSEPKQMISGVVTDARPQADWDKLALTEQEQALVDKAGGNLDQLPEGSAKRKLAAQYDISRQVDTMSTLPEYLESDYQQAQRAASQLGVMPDGVRNELRMLRVADLKARDERTSKASALEGTAQDYIDKVLDLRAEQGKIADTGTRWGKANRSTGSGTTGVSSKGLNSLRSAVSNKLKGFDVDPDDNQDVIASAESMYKDLINKQGMNPKAAEELVRSKVTGDEAWFFGDDDVDIETKFTPEEMRAYDTMFSGTGTGTSQESLALGQQIARLQRQAEQAQREAGTYRVGREDQARALAGNRLDSILDSIARPKVRSAVADSGSIVESARKSETPVAEVVNPEDIEAMNTAPVSGQEQSRRELVNAQLAQEANKGNLSPFENTLRQLGLHPEQREVETYAERSAAQQQARDRNLELRSEQQQERNIEELKDEPEVLDAYDRAWRAEARRRGYIGTGIRPFSLEEFILQNYVK